MNQKIPYISQIGEENWAEKLISILKEDYQIKVDFTMANIQQLQEKEKELNYKFPESFKTLYLELGYFSLGDNDLELFTPDKIHKLIETTQYTYMLEGLDEYDKKLANDLIMFAVGTHGTCFFMDKKAQIIQYHYDTRKLSKLHRNFNDFMKAQIIDLSWGPYGVGDFEAARKLKKKLKIQFGYY